MHGARISARESTEGYVLTRARAPSLNRASYICKVKSTYEPGGPSGRRFKKLMSCNMGTRTILSAIFALRVFESVSKTCNMLPQQIVALKIVRAVCYTASTFSAKSFPVTSPLRPCYTRQFFLQLFVAGQVARKISRVTTQFCNLQGQQNVALRVARKVEISCA